MTATDTKNCSFAVIQLSWTADLDVENVFDVGMTLSLLQGLTDVGSDFRPDLQCPFSNTFVFKPSVVTEW